MEEKRNFVNISGHMPYEEFGCVGKISLQGGMGSMRVVMKQRASLASERV